jgi:hypothetical protein
MVDIYNYTSNTWSYTFLTQARGNIAATTVLDLAIFGGGITDATVRAIYLKTYDYQ